MIRRFKVNPDHMVWDVLAGVAALITIGAVGMAVARLTYIVTHLDTC